MATPQPGTDTKKNAKIMFGIFSVLTLIFVCGGGFLTGVFGSQSETDGMNAAMAMTGPGCCAISGLLMSGISMFALAEKPSLQFVAPIVAGVFGGFMGASFIFVFFTAIWPSL